MTSIKVTVGFKDMNKDQEVNFIFDANQSKIAIERALTHFLVFNDEFKGWQFANWNTESSQGTVFNSKF